MIAVFDLGGPLLAYALLRSAGMSAVAALVISGVLPALSTAPASSTSPNPAGPPLYSRPYTLVRCLAH
jgi:hypothetical protein